MDKKIKKTLEKFLKIMNKNFSQEDLKLCCAFAFENNNITFDYKEKIKKYK